MDDNVAVAKRRKAGHGGKREGAGRRRIVQDPERVAVDFERPELAALRELAERRGTTIPMLIRQAVSQYLKRSRRS